MVSIVFVILGILVFVYYYSIGVFFLLRRLGEAKPQKVFIPFYAFSLLGRQIGAFPVFTIPVKNYSFVATTFLLIPIFACIYGLWGNDHLPPESVVPLWEIMAVVMAGCFVAFYASLISSTKKVMLKFKIEREKRYIALAALILPLPFVYLWLSKKELRIL